MASPNKKLWIAFVVRFSSFLRKRKNQGVSFANIFLRCQKMMSAALSYVIQSYLERHFWLCAYNSSLKKASDLKILLSKIQSSHTEIFFDPVGF
jgi:hypothetical protein